MNTTNTVPSKGSKLIVKMVNPRAVRIDSPKFVEEIVTVVSVRNSARGPRIHVTTDTGIGYTITGNNWRLA